MLGGAGGGGGGGGGTLFNVFSISYVNNCIHALNPFHSFDIFFAGPLNKKKKRLVCSKFGHPSPRLDLKNYEFNSEFVAVEGMLQKKNHNSKAIY